MAPTCINRRQPKRDQDRGWPSQRQARRRLGCFRNGDEDGRLGKGESRIPLQSLPDAMESLSLRKCYHQGYQMPAVQTGRTLGFGRHLITHRMSKSYLFRRAMLRYS